LDKIKRKSLLEGESSFMFHKDTEKGNRVGSKAAKVSRAVLGKMAVSM